MKVLVCGGRDFSDQKFVFLILNRLDKEKKITEIIEGGATGADTCARAWAKWYNVKCTTVKADWNSYGRSAGSIRNKLMADLKPQLVVAFKGGKGTANMIAVAKNKGIKVLEAK